MYTPEEIEKINETSKLYKDYYAEKEKNKELHKRVEDLVLKLLKLSLEQANQPK